MVCLRGEKPINSAGETQPLREMAIAVEPSAGKATFITFDMNEHYRASPLWATGVSLGCLDVGKGEAGRYPGPPRESPRRRLRMCN